jgi:hypothetical protein
MRNVGGLGGGGAEDGDGGKMGVGENETCCFTWAYRKGWLWTPESFTRAHPAQPFYAL